jgi:hypothetical protein
MGKLIPDDPSGYLTKLRPGIREFIVVLNEPEAIRRRERQPNLTVKAAVVVAVQDPFFVWIIPELHSFHFSSRALASRVAYGAIARKAIHPW